MDNIKIIDSKILIIEFFVINKNFMLRKLCFTLRYKIMQYVNKFTTLIKYYMLNSWIKTIVFDLRRLEVCNRSNWRIRCNSQSASRNLAAWAYRPVCRNPNAIFLWLEWCILILWDILVTVSPTAVSHLVQHRKSEDLAYLFRIFISYIMKLLLILECNVQLRWYGFTSERNFKFILFNLYMTRK